MKAPARFLTVDQYRRLHGVAGKRGPNGRKLCACGTEVKGKRIHWCSDECSQKWNDENNWTHIRYQVLARDKGVCAVCQLDTIAAYRAFSKEYPHYWIPEARAKARSLGIPNGRITSDWWDADHIVAIVDGGKNNLENLRTLCIPCHKKATAELAARRARERKMAKALPLLEANA